MKSHHVSTFFMLKCNERIEMKTNNRDEFEQKI